MPRSHAYLLWSLLALPAVLILWQAMHAATPEIYGDLAHPAAEFAARLMIVAMMITPLMLFFKGSEALRWLRKSRRALGVAAFAYAALHVMFYLIDRGTSAKVLADLSEPYIWAGWLGLIILVPLAVTSNDYFLRRLGRRWKPLQKWTYAVAALTLLHWAAIHDWQSPAEAILHFAPLLGLQAYRIWYWTLRPRAPRGLQSVPLRVPVAVSKRAQPR